MALRAPEPGRAVLVTGASSGIGRELARGLAARGHELVITARDEGRLLALATELRERHDAVVDIELADLAEPEDRAALWALLAARPPLAALCNNAGIGSRGDVHAVDPARQREIVALNVVALHELTLAALPAMVRAGSGAVLNVGSILGAAPWPGKATYAATKAFVQSFSEALHVELDGTGVSCTVVSPGPVATAFAAVAGQSGLAGRMPAFTKPSAAAVADTAIEAMRVGRRSVVPGVVWRVAAGGARHVPRSLALRATRVVARER